MRISATLILLLLYWPLRVISATNTATSTSSETISQSIPTGSATVTTTISLTESLRTRTKTYSKSASLPTSTRTTTYSLSPSYSETLTQPGHTNYTMDMAPDPQTGVLEGREFRIKLTTSSMEGEVKKHFKSNDSETAITVRMFNWDANNDADCSRYSNPISEQTGFGISDEERYSETSYVDTAYVTMTAPTAGTTFVLCFYHNVDTQIFKVPPYNPVDNTWVPFYVSSTLQYRFESVASQMWYNLPDPTINQYAIIQLISGESYNFTYSSTTCQTNLIDCGMGDQLKIVPSGSACTYEQHNYNKKYKGSDYVQHDGTWGYEAISGIKDGATPGGVGLFGTQYGNPLVDSWSSWGVYLTENSNSFSFAYVYVRLPSIEGNSYDVCYSSKEQRASWKSDNTTVGSIPMWRKIYRCREQHSSKCPDITSKDLSFQLKSEPVGWNMYDLSPGSWGDIIFDDSSEGFLSSVAASGSSTIDSSTSTTTIPTLRTAWNANYWNPTGGDYFRIVPSSKFTEGGSSSFPTSGCWDRSLDSTNGFADAASEYPIGSRDLTGDPTATTSVGDESNIKNTFSNLYLPTLGSEWFVCYRRTCVASSTYSDCPQNSGLRLLPYHYSGIGYHLSKWTHLESSYPYSQMLIPDNYTVAIDDTTMDVLPPFVTWYANDTRASTWGPIIVEKGISSELEPTMLDSRPWDLINNEQLNKSIGTAIRLVPSGKPCSYNSFQSIPSVGAESLNGGMVECPYNQSYSQSNCEGSSSNEKSVSNVAYYVIMPDVGNYRVCWRFRAWNWRELTASGNPTTAWNDQSNPMPDNILKRGDWTKPSSELLTTTTSPLTRMRLIWGETRAGTEAIFIIEDQDSSLQLNSRTDSTTGDLFRIVSQGKGCDINPTSYNKGILIDDRLSIYCPIEGSGLQSQSGIFTSPCSSAWSTVSDMYGLNIAETAFLKNTPDLFDDIVPFDITAFDVSKAVAAVELPTQLWSPNSLWSICLKPSSSLNWIILHDAWEMTEPSGYTLVPSTSEVLVSGELKQFTIDLNFDASMLGMAADRSFPNGFMRAKLVRKLPFSGNDNCLNLPASTEATPYASATSSVYGVKGENTKLRFLLVAPEEAGNYHLCVQIREDVNATMSWWNVGVYTVIDNGIRWYVTPGNQPTNNGLSSVKLVKCKLTNNTCDPSKSDGTFDTSDDEDSAKIISIDSSCNSGESNTALWGTSKHVGLGPTGGTAEGVTDLGPSNGQSDIAELKVTLPPQQNDIQMTYKVCVRTQFYIKLAGGFGERRWVEVSQLQSGLFSNQLLVASGFKTERARVGDWVLNLSLRPYTSLYKGPSRDTVALGGASTEIVTNPSSGVLTSIGYGFHFNTYGYDAALGPSNLFKLVQAKKPGGRLPGTNPDWGSVNKWQQISSDCSDPAVESSSNIAGRNPCVEGRARCPSLKNQNNTQIPAMFHIPIHPGEYIVCYKVVHSTITTPQPWLQLSSSESGSYSLYSHPSFLEIGAGSRNSTAYDVRVASNQTGGLQISVSSWCSTNVGGQGVDCYTQNSGGFSYDLLTIVNDTQVCPAPSSFPLGSTSGPPDWFKLGRTSNASVNIIDTWSQASSSNESVFQLPPALQSETGQYKLCIYKAGEAKTGFFSTKLVDSHVAKAGIVYQAYVLNTESGYWGGSKGTPSSLVVSTDLSYNISQRFIEYNGTETDTKYSIEEIPEDLVTDNTTGKLSRTPLLRSGTSVEFIVRTANANGDVLPVGNYEVRVLTCKSTTSWSGLSCDLIGKNEFIIWNIDGACHPSRSLKYGWEPNGLKQFMIDGSVSLNIQYRSSCPDSMFGCGIIFQAVTGRQPETVISSKPQWINIDSHPPTAVTLDDKLIQPMVNSTSSDDCSDSSTTCYMKVCISEQLCTIQIQARFGGPTEFSPNETYSVSYYDTDASSSARKLVGTSLTPMPLNKNWNIGGKAIYSFTPRLLSGNSNSGEVLLKFEYHTSWTRFVIRVIRRAPSKINVSAVIPLDSEIDRLPDKLPAPAFPIAGSSDTGFSIEGGYLEALCPYRLIYTPIDEDGNKVEATPLGLDGWSLSARITSPGNRVIGVIRDSSGKLTPDNLIATPWAVLTPIFSSPARVGSQWVLDFRVHISNNGCSRFVTSIQGHSGCEIQFTFTHFDQIKVSLSIFTSVRIIASTLLIKTSTVKSTIRQGIVITAIPGTYVASSNVFVNDEFHFADVFSLINTPGPSNGAVNRDGVRSIPDVSPESKLSGCAFYSSTERDHCLIHSYSTQLIAGATPTWGARWTLRTSSPCYNCEFTFHSSLGAGPHISTQDPTDPGYAVRTLTWADEIISFRCTGDNKATPVTTNFESTKTESYRFSIKLEATSTGGQSAYFPRWWVFTDTRSDVEHISGSTASAATRGNQFTLKMDGDGGQVSKSEILTSRMGEMATANFSNLYFEGTPPVDRTTEQVTAVFHAVGYTYSSTDDAIGSRPVSTKAYTCKSYINIERWIASEPSRHINITNAVGAQDMCGGVSFGCNNWVATTAEFSSGTTFTVGFYNRSSDPYQIISSDLSSRNATIVLTSGEATTPIKKAPSWAANAAYGTFESEDLTIDSTWNQKKLETIGGKFYTFGTVSAIATRRNHDGSTVLRGEGQITLSYGKHGVSTTAVDKSPARELVFQICSSQWDDSLQKEVTSQISTLCTEIHLWIIPSQDVSLQLVTSTEPASGQKFRGPSQSCGLNPTLLSTTVMSYYDLPGGSTLYRYYSYSSPIVFKMRIDGQTIAALGSTTANSGLSFQNPVPISTDLRDTLSHVYNSSSLSATFSFYGRDVAGSVSNTLPIIITATRADDRSVIPGIFSSGAYYWIDPAEDFASWEVSDEVTYDTECPSRRRLQSSILGYRYFDTDLPGKGWEFSHQATVGLPIPIQTVVRNTVGNRAWSFKSGTKIKVTKKGWTGCNHGGTLLVHTLLPSNSESNYETLVGDVTKSWKTESQNMVETNMGIGIPWVTFSEPCELCTLQLELCYSNAVGEECLESLGSDSSEQSDVVPVFADRKKITKGFSVRQQEPDLVDIYSQTIPGEDISSSFGKVRRLFVGDEITVDLETIQTFGPSGKWSFISKPVGGSKSSGDWIRKLFVRSTWLDSHSSPSQNEATSILYGNGGFFSNSHRTENVQGCSAISFVTAEEFTFSPPAPTQLVDAGDGRVKFFFVRTCSRCSVQIDYTLENSEIMKTGSITLRRYIPSLRKEMPILDKENVLQFTVNTCATSWMLAGIPVVAVKSRRPFSLSAIRVNKHKQGSWGYEGSAPASIVIDRELNSGNGGGGEFLITSPTGHAGVIQTISQRGSATVRLQSSRPCFRCDVSLAHRQHTFTILTDATQFIVMPLSRSKDTKWLHSQQSQSGTWQFEVYAADDLGHRSYIVGGPTPAAFQPKYGNHLVNPLLLDLKTKEMTTYNAILVDPRITLIKLSSGLPESIEITSGKYMANGIPVPQLESLNQTVPTGSIAVKISGNTPSVDHSIELSDSFYNIPTRLYGTMKVPKIHYSMPAKYLVLDNPRNARPGGCKTDGLRDGLDKSCKFNAYVAAPSFQNNGNFYLSSERVVGIEVTTTCSSSCTAIVSGNGIAVSGIATFSLQLSNPTTGTCQCTVSVVPPEIMRSRNATTQTFAFSIGVSPTPADNWKFDSSPTVSVDKEVAFTVVNTSVEVFITNLGYVPSPDSTSIVTFSNASLVPSGCFKVSNVKSDLVGGIITLSGEFVVVGSCVVPLRSLSIISRVGIDLIVTVGNPFSLRVVQHETSTLILTSNFSDMTSVTLSGERAAVVGIGSNLVIEVIDESGNRVIGDNIALITLVGIRSSTINSTWDFDPQIVTNGIAVFHLSPSSTTRASGNCEHSGMHHDLHCNHHPWYFTVENDELGNITHIGPLHFVRSISHLKTDCILNSEHYSMVDPSEEFNASHEIPNWVHGFIFDIIIQAIDFTGSALRHPEDFGSSIELVIRPLALPCITIDSSSPDWIFNTCMSVVGTKNSDFKCKNTKMSALGRCLSSGWSFTPQIREDDQTDSLNSSDHFANETIIQPHPQLFTDDSSGSLLLPLHGGEAFLPSTVYSGQTDSIKKFRLTSTTEGVELSYLMSINLPSISEIILMGGNPCSFSGVLVCRIPENLLSGGSILTNTKFNLVIAVRDIVGDVIVGNSDSSIQVRSTCLEAAGFGFVGKDWSNRGVVDTLTPLIFPVIKGLAHLNDLQFSGGCNKLELSFSCISGPLDSLRSCDGITMKTSPFNVTLGGDIQTPPKVQVQMSLGMFVVVS